MFSYLSYDVFLDTVLLKNGIINQEYRIEEDDGPALREEDDEEYNEGAEFSRKGRGRGRGRGRSGGRGRGRSKSGPLCLDRGTLMRYSLVLSNSLASIRACMICESRASRRPFTHSTMHTHVSSCRQPRWAPTGSCRPGAAARVPAAP